MEENAIKNISGWQNNEYVIVGYTDLRDVEEFIRCNITAFNRAGSKVAIIKLNSDTFYSIADPEKTIILQNCDSIFELRRCARLSVRKNNVQALFIDDLKSANCQNLYLNSGTDPDKIISRGVRGLCRELGRPIISLIPITFIENDSGFNILKSIGELGADADVVVFLKRDENDRLKLLVAKNRNGFISDFYHSPTKARR